LDCTASSGAGEKYEPVVREGEGVDRGAVFALFVEAAVETVFSWFF
jgi:hypothetical protein